MVALERWCDGMQALLTVCFAERFADKGEEQGKRLPCQVSEGTVDWLIGISDADLATVVLSGPSKPPQR